MSIHGFRWVIAVLPLLVFAACGGGSDAPVTQPPVPQLAISPSSANVLLGATAQFTATVTGTDNQQVTWQVNTVTGGSATTGTIGASGLFTAPMTMPASNQVTVQAILAADTSITRTATITLTAPVVTTYRTIGYMPDWTGDVTTLQYSKLTHINYAFLLAKAEGTLDSTGITSSRLQQLVGLAHASGTKVIISLGGWNNKDALGGALRSATARAALATNCLAFVNQYDLDGLDVDWEGISSASDGAAFSAFMQTIYTSLHPANKLTTTAVAWWFGQNIPAGAFYYCDFVNVMCYDFPGTQHSSYADSLTEFGHWVSLGIAKDKLNLGVPFYGYPGTGRSTSKEYSDICAADANAQNTDISNGYDYNGIPTIQQKATYVVNQKAGGIMIWELSGDATGSKSLLSAINTVLSGN